MASFLVSSKNASLSSLLWLRREHTWTLNWKEVCFQNCLDLPFPTVRVGIGWSTLCNSLALSPHVRDSQEDKSILVYFKKVFLIRSVWPVTKYTFEKRAYWLVLKATMVWYLLFPTHQSRQRMVNTLLMVKITVLVIWRTAPVSFYQSNDWDSKEMFLF